MTGVTQHSLRIACSVSADVTALTDLLISFEKVVPRPIEVVELLRGLPGPASVIECNTLPADGAGECRLTVDLNGRGLELFAALRALDVPRDLISKSGHVSVSVGSVGTTSEEQPLGESQGSSEGVARNSQGGVI